MIPEFAIGDRVRVTIRPTLEYACEECGDIIAAEWEGMTSVGIIVPIPSAAQCVKCGHRRSPSEGEYAVQTTALHPWCVPWTWMEPLGDQE